MASSNFPDLSFLKRFAKENLSAHLHFFDGMKDLVLDEELMKPLDIIAGISFFRENNAGKIYKLQNGPVPQGCDKRIFIVRPYVDRMRLVVESINKDKEQAVSRKYHLVFSPKKLAVCDIILEEEGIYGDVTMDEFPLDLIPLDHDLVSLEMPFCFKQFFLEGDLTWLHTVANAIVTFQGTYGVIPKGVILGEKAKMLHDLVKLLMVEQKDYYPLEGLPVGSFIFVDRNVDLVSMLCSQLTYEGLVAEAFKIRSSIVEFSKEITGADQVTRLTLNSNDQVFAEIRGMHANSVFPLLSHKAKQLQCVYEKRNNLNSVQDMKSYVSEDLKSLKHQQKSLALHIGACEKILSDKTAENFEDCLHVEQCMLEDSESKECLNFVEASINRQSPELHCLRLLCLLSLCKGGIDSKHYRSLKLQYLQSFGYHHMLTMKKLRDAGLFTESSDKRNTFPKIRKKFNLIPKDAESVLKAAVPKDLSYVFGGAYSPFLVKLVELIITKGVPGWLEESLKPFQIPIYEYKHATTARQSGSSSTMKLTSEAQKTIFIVWNGGCTHTEINAVRFIGNLLGYRFIIMTTAIYTAEEFLSTLVTT